MVQRGSAARPGGDQPLRALESCALVTALDVREARVGCWGGHAAAEAVKDSTAVWGSRRADGERESGRKEREREGERERARERDSAALHPCHNADVRTIGDKGCGWRQLAAA